MTLHAKDIMVTRFETIHEEAPIDEAIDKIAHGIVRDTGYKTISLMVIDDIGKLAGVVTMFDILYHLRPSFLNLGVDGKELNWEGQLKILLEMLHGKKVSDIMSRHVVGVEADDHLVVILDRMVKNKYRRLPVLKNSQPIGIVYISDIFHTLFLEKRI